MLFIHYLHTRSEVKLSNSATNFRTDRGQTSELRFATPPLCYIALVRHTFTSELERLQWK